MDQGVPPYFLPQKYSSQPRRGRRTPSVPSAKGSRDVKKQTIKYLGVCRDKKAFNAVVKAAPDCVIKTICDATLNVQRGDRVALSDAQRKLFRRHRGVIAKLVSRKPSLKTKRKLIGQSGGAFFLPLILKTVLGALGGSLFGGNKE